jgi:hypothetical protein
VCDIEGIVAILEKQETERKTDDDSAQSALLAGLAATTHGYGGGGLVPTPVYRILRSMCWTLHDFRVALAPLISGFKNRQARGPTTMPPDLQKIFGFDAEVDDEGV